MSWGSSEVVCSGRAAKDVLKDLIATLPSLVRPARIARRWVLGGVRARPSWCHRGSTSTLGGMTAGEGGEGCEVGGWLGAGQQTLSVQRESVTCTRGRAGGDRQSDASWVGSELVFDDCGGMQSVRVVDRSRTESRRMSEVRLVCQVVWAERGGLILVWMERTASRDRGGCEKRR